MMVKRVVFLRSNPVAPDPRVEKQAKALASMGYDVSVTCWDRESELSQNAIDFNLPCHRIHIRADYGQGIGNAIPILRWQFSLLLWLIRSVKQFDIIHACDFDTVLPALICKRIFKKKLVYDIFDFYADHIRSSNRPLRGIIKQLDLFVINCADAIILVDESRRQQIADTQPKQLAIIVNTPPDKLAKLKEHAQNLEPDALRLTYVGILQTDRSLLEMISIVSAHPEWILDLAGFGGDQADILRHIEHINNINWHGRLNYEDTMQLSYAGDLMFAIYDPAVPNNRLASPNKVFEAMMLAKPIIVAKDTQMQTIVEQHKCGVSVEYGNKSELESAVQQLAGDKEKRKQLGENARRAYESHFSWVEMSERLSQIYATL